MNRKRNVSYIKPEDPEFLKVLKKQAGYDDRNHKFDELENSDGDFVDDEDSEQPQVVVLKPGDLTAEEVEAEKVRIDKKEAETKADLTQRVIFKSKHKEEPDSTKKLKKEEKGKTRKQNKIQQLLSFGDDDEEESPQ